MSSSAPDQKPPMDQKQWAQIIGTVKTPLAFFALIVLVIDVLLLPLAMTMNDDHRIWVAVPMLLLLFLVVGCVAAMAFWKPESLVGESPREASVPARPADAEPNSAPSQSTESDIAGIVDREGKQVLYYSERGRPRLDFWFREMRPYLHQAAHYSIPMYFLDTKLNVIDWNIAFDIVFAELVGQIRGRHVNWFIARLANHDQVFDHAREFTKQVIEQGVFPYADKEPIEYDSPEYGRVRTLKLATQLTDTHGEGKGWAVALIPLEIAWPEFVERLFARIQSDKMWSIYSASYDRVLLRFPPYKTLIQDVTAVVPNGSLSVLDLGSGTGNTTAALVERGHRVTAIEDNLGMLDRFAAKPFDPELTKLVRSSVEHLDFLPSESFDAAVMVNVLYALERPQECLRSVHRILKGGGVLGLSTTHRETDLDPLLEQIEAELRRTGKLDKYAKDWDAVRQVNKELERTVVRRHTREDVREMVTRAGFDITKDVSSTYEGAVMLLHARKADEESDSE